ncbi:MAG: UDP-glucose/GDP-mannose dehydrogenase family protein [Spirochaetia bacterium]|nr:UDP-glucose/GDP-mannose dehydrogenase family protein [Spirochaetales bacterium]MBR5927908.1 UDP-glucose/GDP-mannose dehydrogenase family protein [Spirochaetia bacterium]
MKISVVGTGYVGLVSGACFAEFGWDVTCIDKSPERIESLKRGIIPIYEPGLDELVLRNVKAGRLSFSLDYAPFVEESDAVFIAVGTPSRRGDGHADLTYVYAAAKEIAEHLTGYTVVVDKSTVPVGTAREVAAIIRKANPKADFDIASNPEFLREGSAIGDFMRPDRVVIGVESEKAKAVLKELYRPLYLLETPMVITNLETAELIKYASNAFLAVKISFINEISALCEKTGADIKAISKGMGLDKRIGSKFLHAGPGYGGSCFPKDVSALIRIFHDNGLEPKILEAVTEVNQRQKLRMADKVKDLLGQDLTQKTIAVLGLTFKPETDDMREAPSLVIVPELASAGAHIRACDPQGVKEARKLLPAGVEYLDSPYDAAKDADAVVILTEWNQFRALDIQRLKKAMRGNLFADFRNIYDRALLEKAGFVYIAVGR